MRYMILMLLLTGTFKAGAEKAGAVTGSAQAGSAQIGSAQAVEEEPLRYKRSFSLSLAEQFNKGLSFYQQGQEGLAKAYWRPVLFQRPYDSQVQLALKTVGDKKYFWLWIPEDLVLLVISLCFLILCLCMWRFLASLKLSVQKKTGTEDSQALIFWLFIQKKPILLLFCLMCFALGAVYFYFRYSDYYTLAEDSAFLSAPDPGAPVLFEKTGGELLKQISSRKAKGEESWSHVRLPDQQTGWLKSDKLIAINPRP